MAFGLDPEKLKTAAAAQQLAGGAGGGGGLVGGAMSGAAAGSAFGPKGALIGAGVGALKGVLGARSKRKAEQRRIAGEKEKRLGDIQLEKAARMQAAFQSMAGNLGNIIR